MGLKVDDFQAVPLCAAHHSEWHNRAAVAPYDGDETCAILDRAVTALLRKALLEKLELEE